MHKVFAVLILCAILEARKETRTIKGKRKGKLMAQKQIQIKYSEADQKHVRMAEKIAARPDAYQSQPD